MTLRNYIDGRWQAPGHELAPSVCDANTGEPLFKQAASSAEQIEKAIDTARAIHQQGAWTQLGRDVRAGILRDMAERVLGRAEDIAQADAQCTGVVIGLTSKLAQVCAGAFRQAADRIEQNQQPTPRDGAHGALQIERLPLGPAAVIAPWNAPAGIAAHKLASALAAGCPVLLKPSEWAPLSAQIIVEAAAQSELPAGMLQLLHGDGAVGAALTADDRVRAVSFTGGLAGGRAVAAACAQGIKPAQLELGGNNPLVVLKSADLDRAADGVVTALTTLNGQWCRALGRLLVHQDCAEQLLAKVSARLADIRMGSSLDADSQMGPLVSQRHRQTVLEQRDALQAKGGRLIQPVQAPDLPGWFVAPTLICDLDPAQTLDEVFGPVAVVHTFADDAQAIELANQTPFGLAAYVFGEEDQAWKVADRIRSGLIKINAVSLLNLHPLAPRPAWGLSGLGDEGAYETFEFFRGTRVIGVGAR